MAEAKSAGRSAVTVLGLVLGIPIGLAVLLAAGLASGAGSLVVTPPGASAPSAYATSTLPATYMALYTAAAASCPGLDWTLLAAVGTIETTNGSSTLPGVSSGANLAGAEGPMQFEPATFAAYANPTPPGGANPASPYDPADAIYAAARYLCSLGIGTDPTAALIAYNCGSDSAACEAASGGYAAQAEALAASYAAGGASTTAVAEVAAYAQSQLGVTYVWGGESPGVAFDCSGLAQWAYAQAGISIGRTAEDQWSSLGHVSTLVPGDLVFFGSGNYASHVGIYAGDGQMIDAPDTGSVVRYDTIPTTPGQRWGSDTYLGAAA
jgi:cell wall-associated NlpC family hydrolase